MRAGVLVPLVMVMAACGGSDGGSADSGSAPAATPAAAGSELTAEQLEKGIGPVTSVTLGEAIDEAMAAQGAEVFTLKCSACHKLEARYVGPQLGGVLERRTPEFVMNMILNPVEMMQSHPETKKLLSEFMTPMPDLNLTQEEARAILEYVRSWKQE